VESTFKGTHSQFRKIRLIPESGTGFTCSTYWIYAYTNEASLALLVLWRQKKCCKPISHQPQARVHVWNNRVIFITLYSCPEYLEAWHKAYRMMATLWHVDRPVCLEWPSWGWDGFRIQTGAKVIEAWASSVGVYGWDALCFGCSTEELRGGFVSQRSKGMCCEINITHVSIVKRNSGRKMLTANLITW
jgi:hypothetical protein